MAQKVHLAVLISGGGTNLQAIIDAIEQKRLDATIRVVISNRGDAYGLVRAKNHGIPTEVMDHRKSPSREDFDQVLIDILNARQVELVILAGFMRLLSPEYGVRFSGCTVHLVNEECDQGPVIIQAVVPVFPDDTEKSLSARILNEEHRIYPRAIQLYGEGRLHVMGRKVVVDGMGKEEDRVQIWPPLKG